MMSHQIQLIGSPDCPQPLAGSSAALEPSHPEACTGRDDDESPSEDNHHFGSLFAAGRDILILDSFTASSTDCSQVLLTGASRREIL